MMISVTHRSKLITRYNRLVQAVVQWLNPRRLKVYPTTVAVLTLAVWLAWQLMGPGLTDITGTNIGVDFAEFYMGGRFFLEGRIADLYNFPVQRLYQTNLVAPAKPHINQFHPFVYPPFSVVLYLPFALGDYLAGLFLWWGAGLFALTFSSFLLRQELFHPGAVSALRLLGLSLLFYPTLAWFMFGQNTAFTLLLYTLAFVLLRRKQDFAAGLVAGLLLYKPQLALALGVTLLVKQRWQALGGVAATGAVLVVAGFLISPAAMINFARLIPMLPELERADLNITWGISSFFGFSALLLDGIWQAGADLLTTGLTVGGLVYLALWWRRSAWQPGSRTWDLGWAATFAWGLLISPQLFLYDLMLLLLPLAIVWSYYPKGGSDRPLDGGPLLAWTALLYVATLVSHSLSVAQSLLSLALGLPEVAVQSSTLVIAGWAWIVYRLAEDSATSNRGLTRG